MNIHKPTLSQARHRPTLAIVGAAALGAAILLPGSAPSAVGTASPPPACSSIRAELGRLGGAAGSAYQTIRLRNTGTGTCRIGGFPSVEYVNRHHHMIGWPARHNPVKRRPQTLAPGVAARTVLQIPDPSNFARIDCLAHNAHQIRVRVGSAPPSYLKWDRRECTTRFARSLVSPIRR